VRAEVWRALHGLLGMETYDARWSAIYGELTTASRLITPFAILGAAAVLMAAPTSGRSRLPKALGLLLLAALVTESILVGALPRYALPFLPALFLFAFGCASELLASSAGRRAAAVAIALALVFAIRWQRQTLDWEWGLIDASGVRLRLVVPRGRLPEPGETPATLHVRIGASVHPAAVAVTIRDERGEILPAQGPPSGPFVSVSLTDAVRRANRERDVALTLVSSGSFDSTHFLIFPAIPPPWAAATLREGSPALSGETGIAAGSLDWWAHAGAP
jgi:hypothetical protein